MSNTIESSPDRGTEDYWTVYDESSQAELTSVIIGAVAHATGRDPLDLPSLRKVINPDALNELLVDSEHSKVNIRFEYAGCDVLVTGNGQISVYEW